MFYQVIELLRKEYRYRHVRNFLEFLRDYTDQRRITVMNDRGHHHPIQMWFNLSQNNQAVYKDLNDIHGPRRRNYECKTISRI